MADDLFDLVFSGEVVTGKDVAVVKKNFAGLFKISPAQAEALFSGKAITLKKNLSLDAAKRYRVAIKNAGGKVVLRRSGEPANSAKPKSVSAVKPKAPTGAPAQAAAVMGAKSLAEASPVADPSPVAEEEAPPPMPEVAEASEEEAEAFEAAQAARSLESRKPVKQASAALSIAAPGADVLAPEERTQTNAVEVDTSSLSLRDGEGRLVDEQENLREAPVQVDIPEIEITELGADLLEAEEKREFKSLDIDLEHMSIAEVGARLGAEDASPIPPPPNTGHLSVAD